MKYEKEAIGLLKEAENIKDCKKKTEYVLTKLLEITEGGGWNLNELRELISNIIEKL